MEFVDVVTCRDGCCVVRRPASDHLSLKIDLVAPRRPPVRVGLAAGGDGLAVIDRLPPGARVEVSVAPQRLWQRLHLGSQHASLRLDGRPFRLLIIGSGRCGTMTVARWLEGAMFTDGTPVRAGHESLAPVMLKALATGNDALFRRLVRGQGHNVEAGAFYALRADHLQADRIVHLVRDGRRVVQSGLNRGWYRDDSPWNRIKPPFAGDRFARCCSLWAHTVAASDRVADEVVRLEDLVGDEDVRRAALSRWGLCGHTRSLPHANRGGRSSDAAGWQPGQRAVFDAICGRLMDRHYPGWRSAW